MGHPKPSSREPVRTAANPVRIFCSYASKDRLFCDELLKHLVPLERDGSIEVRSDQDILPGSDPDKTIRDELSRADIICVLVSKESLSCDRIYHSEITFALERHNAEVARVIPIILSECSWKNTPLKNLRALPKQGTSVRSQNKGNRDEAWQEIIEELRKVIDQIAEDRNAASHSISVAAPLEETPAPQPRDESLCSLVDRDVAAPTIMPKSTPLSLKPGAIPLGLVGLCGAAGMMFLFAIVFPNSCDNWLGSGPVKAIAYSKNGHHVASAVDKVVTIWNIDTRHELCMLRGHKDIIHSVAFSSPGHLLLTASADGTARIWGADTCKLLHSLAMPASKRVTVANFSHDTKRLITASADGITRVWSLTDLRDLFSLEQPAVNIDVWAEFSPDDQMIATANFKGDVKVWRSRDGSLLQRLSGHADTVWMTAFSPDGLLLATAGEDQTVRIWRTADGHLEKVLKGHTQPVRSVRFSPDGKYLVTASSDRSARVWNWRDSQQTVLIGHVRGVSAAEFSPDGKTVVTGSADYSVRVWEAESGKELYRLHSIPLEFPAQRSGSSESRITE